MHSGGSRRLADESKGGGRAADGMDGWASPCI